MTEDKQLIESRKFMVIFVNGKYLATKDSGFPYLTEYFDEAVKFTAEVQADPYTKCAYFSTLLNGYQFIHYITETYKVIKINEQTISN